MDPYEIWGNGEQERDFTYVEDIVEGCILASEKITNCTPINLGTGHKYQIKEVADMIFKILNWKPSRIAFDESKPVGALSRALDNSKANELLGWVPRFSLEDGLIQTIDWYRRAHSIEGGVSERILLEH
jgi:UDP-glucose 4-epimerase